KKMAVEKFPRENRPSPNSTQVAASRVREMTQTPTLGICITYYNECELLTEALDSIEKQAEKPDEILIYDDSSAFPAEKFIPKGMSVRVYRGRENRGVYFARSKLLELASADYVHFHDADDLLLPHWSNRVMDIVRARQPDVILTEILRR